MFRKLFQVAVLVCLVVVTVAALAVIGGVILSVVSQPNGGISAGSGGASFQIISISKKQLGFMIVAASLIIAGFYLYRRRSRFRR